MRISTFLNSHFETGFTFCDHCFILFFFVTQFVTADCFLGFLFTFFSAKMGCSTDFGHCLRTLLSVSRIFSAQPGTYPEFRRWLTHSSRVKALRMLLTASRTPPLGSTDSTTRRRKSFERYLFTKHSSRIKRTSKFAYLAPSGNLLNNSVIQVLWKVLYPPMRRKRKPGRAGGSAAKAFMRG